MSETHPILAGHADGNVAARAQMRSWGDAVERALDERGGPRPLEFDASGFPIPQPTQDFTQRVERLIRGD